MFDEDMKGVTSPLVSISRDVDSRERELITELGGELANGVIGGRWVAPRQ